jgi:hypothetical protein
MKHSALAAVSLSVAVCLAAYAASTIVADALATRMQHTGAPR